ncbi:MAG: tetratricopeptide repeat protein [Saprospiraceae bacterium]|nr:tetratricopeptide repeat protein [Saprospiraceae bacterium]
MKLIEYCQKAIECHQKALGIRLKALEPEHLDVAASYNNLGNSFDNKGEYDKAIECHQKALEIRLKALGAEHRNVATSYNNMGSSFRGKGEYDKAIEYYQKALEIRLKVYGPEHPNVAASYNNLGVSFSDKGDYNKAVEYFQKALEVWLKALGPEHPDVASSYNNLGSSFNDKGENDKAVECHQNALEIWLKALGPEHPDVALSYNNLGVSFDGKGEYSKAIVYYQNALEIRLKALGSEHPDVASSHLNLGNSFGNRAEYDKAVEHQQKALEIWLKTLGPRHPDVTLSYNNLGDSFKNKGEYDKAILLYEQGLASCSYGQGDFSKVNSFEKLLYAIKGLNHTLQTQYHQSPAPELLSQFYSYALQSIAALDYQQASLSGEGSKAFWQGKNYPIYEQAISVSLLKAKVDNDETLHRTPFTYAEKSKSSLLQSQIKETDALAFSGIPDSLLQWEHDLRIDLTWREKQRQEKLNSGLEETDTTVLRISSILFDLRQAYDALKARFEKDYPEYYRLKYDLSTASLAYVQDTLLSPNQTLLEYFVGDSSIFIFTVGKGKYDVVEVKKDFPLEDWVKQLQHGLYGYYCLKQSEEKIKSMSRPCWNMPTSPQSSTRSSSLRYKTGSPKTLSSYRMGRWATCLSRHC